MRGCWCEGVTGARGYVTYRFSDSSHGLRVLVRGGMLRTVLATAPMGSGCWCEGVTGARGYDTYRFSDSSHGLRVLMCEEGKQGGEGAETSCEEDEEWKLLLWVD